MRLIGLVLNVLLKEMARLATNWNGKIGYSEYAGVRGLGTGQEKQAGKTHQKQKAHHRSKRAGKSLSFIGAAFGNHLAEYYEKHRPGRQAKRKWQEWFKDLDR